MTRVGACIFVAVASTSWTGAAHAQFNGKPMRPKSNCARQLSIVWSTSQANSDRGTGFRTG